MQRVTIYHGWNIHNCVNVFSLYDLEYYEDLESDGGKEYVLPDRFSVGMSNCSMLEIYKNQCEHCAIVPSNHYVNKKVPVLICLSEPVLKLKLTDVSH